MTRLEKRNRIAELLKEGYSWAQIVQIAHCSFQTISSVVKHHIKGEGAPVINPKMKPAFEALHKPKAPNMLSTMQWDFLEKAINQYSRDKWRKAIGSDIKKIIKEKLT